MQYQTNQMVGNCKTNKVGRIAHGPVKGAHGDFDWFIILTDHYGYEIWEESVLVVLPLEFVRPVGEPAA